ncbi:glutathione S-transferase family protein [Teredinibacter waterburyi]|uniref:glutathione S-transferase family protein n=1 Tax=Teredinibacter waterburyi TaxID=1500538 RepID=UPI00165F7C67|nr:glutathione S-transferase N-terminal domain-containing protein [Teredinibacter waterburyi]
MIDLYTAGTPNGHKISTLLEELEVEYRVFEVDLASKEQKSEKFLKINPNGKIPVIIDRTPKFQHSPRVVFESGAILLYLAKKYGQFLPEDEARETDVIQWLMFQMSGVGPMMGQLNVFRHYAATNIEFAIKRYESEVRRLFETLDSALTGRDYIANEYSIADIALFPWVKQYQWSGVSVLGLKHLQKWLGLVGARKAVKRGCEIPCGVLGGSLSENKTETIEIAKQILVG